MDTDVDVVGVGVEPLQKLARDIRNAAKDLKSDELRYLVDYYYQLQNDRIRAGNRVRALSEGKEPNEVIAWLGKNTATLENNIKSALSVASDAHVLGRWARSQVGIGPVIAAGLMAHIDIEKAPTVGHIWRFAGLDPTVTWNKKEKRPWNADLKTLCWKIGESFVKVSGKDEAFYGKVYAARKLQEQQKNAAGDFADQAKAKLEKFKIGKDTIAFAHYDKGLLPDAHLHSRAKRYAVKLFLSHYHHVAFVTRYNEQPPKPYVISILGHADMINPPNWPMKETA